MIGAMLRNPAYAGRACIGKTMRTADQPGRNRTARLAGRSTPSPTRSPNDRARTAVALSDRSTIDVLQLLREPAALLREVVRLLRPRVRLVATTWEGAGGSPGSFPRNLPALVEDAGLRLDGYIERSDGLHRQLRIYRRASSFLRAAAVFARRTFWYALCRVASC
ncbi:MAG: hypothetical protein LC808_08035 [Actinobacteria bacterium]|nr:hypothetical protein [Actinomycetota bacterium]